MPLLLLLLLLYIVCAVLSAAANLQGLQQLADIPLEQKVSSPAFSATYICWQLHFSVVKQTHTNERNRNGNRPASCCLDGNCTQSVYALRPAVVGRGLL
jgi:hypothetical protein